MLSVLSYLGIFACALLLEVGWVSSVRSVTAGREWLVVGNALLMQGISNTATLILVRDSWTSLASVFGAGLGALIGMRLTSRKLSGIKPQADVL